MSLESNKSSQSSAPNDHSSLLNQLIASQCLKFGKFQLKSGETSDFYLDLREVTRFPSLWQEIVHKIRGILDRRPKSSAPLAIVGVPYGVWPLAAAASFQSQLPFCPIRKEVKGYGRHVDLDLWRDYEFVMIEDVITTGNSIKETIDKMEGLTITDVIIVADRRTDAVRKSGLEQSYPNIRVHSIIQLKDLIDLSKEKVDH